MFTCDPCGYASPNRKDYKRHMNSVKHISNTSQSIDKIPKYECSVCGKVYQSRAGLWKHRIKYNCVIHVGQSSGQMATENAQMETENAQDVISVLKEQIELQRAQNEQQQSQINQMFELLSKTINTNTNVTTMNGNSFNVN